MEIFTKTVFLSFAFLYFVPGAFAQTTPPAKSCDHPKAQVCVLQMEDMISSVLESTSGVSRTERLQRLCLDVIKGNNLTKCFIEATSPCTESTNAKPNDVIQRWERVMQDLYGLCDGACPDFLERTVNITQCTALIRFDALYESSYETFCASMNTSLDCVTDVADECPQFGKLFYDLLPEDMENTASTICTGGCDHFDRSLSMLETCKKYVTDLPDDLTEACESYEKFKTCIKLSEAPVECPMFASLMEVLYPQHIFGLYDNKCNQTTLAKDDQDKCGEVGVARIDHCLRVFALAWPNKVNKKTPTKQQCKDFQTGTRCLERAGFQECASLREYFLEKIKGKERQKMFMNRKCLGILEPSGASDLRLSGIGLLLLIVPLLSFALINMAAR